GRESNSKYGETLNGVQTKNAWSHQFEKQVDPYIKPGDPSSGLLPGVHADGPGEEGQGDHRVQAYNFRICLTDVPENRILFSKPKDYNELRYELLLRYYEAGFDKIPWIRSMMPNRKTDINNRHAFSSDNIGMNHSYPDADYATREKIIAEHTTYQKGLMWTLANHPRVPANIRSEVSKWGLAKDEFLDNGNWPHQLYIREARRMVNDYAMTERNCRGQVTIEDSVGLAAYTMDSHNTQRYVDDNGYARNEGDIQVGGFKPYPISYRSIIAKEEQCSNLLVPICLSASHIAFGSIRMEPVFMVLGQSAASAACLAIDEGVSVQQLDYQKLRKRLLNDRQVLEWE
ncbi:MAG: FAD-dependent oxidoreductase, partial [Sedimentisphaerales bacterium]